MLLIVIQKHWWPQTAVFGVVWCLAGIPLTVVGGINCHPTNNDTMTPTKNDCYFDIEGDKGGLYKSMSIGLLVMHSFSLLLFALSISPFDAMKNQVINDPAPKHSPLKATPSTSTGDNAGANNVATTAASAALSASDLQQADRKRELDARAEELEKKSRRLADQQRELDRRQQEFTRDSHVSVYPPRPPPSYDVVMETSTSIRQVQPVGRLPKIDN